MGGPKFNQRAEFVEMFLVKRWHLSNLIKGRERDKYVSCSAESVLSSFAMDGNDFVDFFQY